MASDRVRTMTMRRAAAGLVIGGCIAGRSSSAQVPSVDSLRALEQRVTYVFDGTVIARNRTGLPNTVPMRRLMLVKVNRTLQCPRGIGDYTGEEVTLFSADTALPLAGTRNWFLAEGWAAGNGLGMIEIAHVAVKDTATSSLFVQRYRDAIKLSADSAVTAWLSMSDAIVTGKIVSLTPITGPARAQSEHDNEFLRAGILISDVIRGSTLQPGQVIQTAFPVRTANPYSSAPALAVGRASMFSLRSSAFAPEVLSRDRSVAFFGPDSFAVRPVADTIRALRASSAVFGVAPVVLCEGGTR